MQSWRDPKLQNCIFCAKLTPRLSTSPKRFNSFLRLRIKKPFLFSDSSYHSAQVHVFFRLMRSKRNARLAKTDEKAFFTKFKSAIKVTNKSENLEVCPSFHTKNEPKIFEIRSSKLSKTTEEVLIGLQMLVYQWLGSFYNSIFQTAKVDLSWRKYFLWIVTISPLI